MDPRDNFPVDFIDWLQSWSGQMKAIPDMLRWIEHPLFEDELHHLSALLEHLVDDLEGKIDKTCAEWRERTDWNTSSPAPPISPASSASVRVSRPTTFPRPILIRMAVRFIAFRAAASIISSVSPVCGTQMATKSDCRSISWSCSGP